MIWREDEVAGVGEVAVVFLAPGLSQWCMEFQVWQQDSLPGKWFLDARVMGCVGDALSSDNLQRFSTEQAAKDAAEALLRACYENIGIVLSNGVSDA